MDEQLDQASAPVAAEMPSVMPVFAPLPEGLAEMTPGPELGAVLATVDRTALNGHQLVVVLAAWHRYRCWVDAQLLADLRELSYTPPGEGGSPPVRQEGRDRYAVEEFSFAVAITAGDASKQFDLAWTIMERLPGVWAALAAGRIDLYKARTIVRELDLVDTDRAQAIVDQVLGPGVERRTVRSIRDRVRRLVLGIDPDLAKKRHQRNVDDRFVAPFSDDPDGTKSLVGRFLPADRVAAAWDYLCRTAAATKAAGDERNLDQIRADVYLDLLSGVDPTRSPAEGGAGAAEPAPRKGVVQLRVDLLTLLGLAEHPGDLHGFGPVVADMARETIEAMGQTMRWRFQVTHEGRLVHEGRLRRRPTPDQASYVRARDETCQAPGCDRPAEQCQIDHITRWDDGGPTLEFNLEALCVRHHRAKDDGGFQVRRTDDGLVWTTPRGHTYPVRLGREWDDHHRDLLQTLIDNERRGATRQQQSTQDGYADARPG